MKKKLEQNDVYKAHQLTPPQWKIFSNAFETLTKMDHVLVSKSKAPQISKARLKLEKNILWQQWIKLELNNRKSIKQASSILLNNP